MIEQRDNMTAGFLTKPQLGWRNALPELTEHVIDLQAQTRGIQINGAHMEAQRRIRFRLRTLLL